MLASLRTAECSVPVVLITAFGDEATHAQALRLGAAALFDKPFDVDDLRAAVSRMIDSA
jgi:DNA-binding response OmpR family regulator